MVMLIKEELKMDRQEVENLLINVVSEIQKISGRDNVEVTSSSKPLLDMPGFDSLNGVEATVEVLSKLNLQLDIVSIFANDIGAISIGEAAEIVMSHMTQKKGR